MREHFLELFREDRSGLGSSSGPLQFSEMDVRIPETGKNKTAGACQFGCVGRNGDVLSDGRDFAIVDQNGGIGKRSGIWLWKNLGSGDGQVCGEGRDAKARETECGKSGYFRNTTPPFMTNETFCKTPMSDNGLPGTATISAK